MIAAFAWLRSVVLKLCSASSQALTEDVMGILLQLIEEELRKEARSPAKLLAEPLAIQVAACIVALCGWAAR